MATGWLRGRVKAVTSGDCLVIVGNVKAGPPPEKTITLASLMAPKLVRGLPGTKACSSRRPPGLEPGVPGFVS